ncbi:hypothetical protein HDV05_008063 [Chytridiales sp. JEL 0842]|nr:hypothetical protein HDV05_008063 [Chytridiales sp. JEL 0842]
MINPTLFPATPDMPRGSSCSTNTVEGHLSNMNLRASMPNLAVGEFHLKLILNARVYDVANETPLTYAPKLSTRFDNTIYLKREDMQPIFSFKCRGAFNRMYQISPQEKANGVICVSAGNHAQGVGLAAKRLGVKAVIVMPKGAPEIKVESVRRLGAQVILFGNDFDEAKKECMRLQKEQNLKFIPPFDDPHVIAGQGTVGVEILRQLKQDRLDAIFVCCGGGGLLAGIAAFVKRVRPEVKIIGVNTLDSDGMYQSLHNDEPTEIKEAGLFADGTSVRLVGAEPFRLCRSLVDDMVLVSSDEICAAIKDIFNDTRSIVEPAGALAVAGIKKFLSANPQMVGGVFVATLSGANMNFDRLRFVAERSRLGDGREVLMSAIIPENAGSFLHLYNNIDPRPVTEVSYRYSDPNTAHIYIAFEVTNGKEEVDEVTQNLAKVGIEAMDITDNEMAKTHMRYLAGGRSATVKDEVLIRFRFPERPGALKKFLNLLEQDWNVSLFHYRNHGADIARVLVGLQVPPDQRDKFQQFLDKLGYFYVDETENPVYKRQFFKDSLREFIQQPDRHQPLPSFHNIAHSKSNKSFAHIASETRKHFGIQYGEVDTEPAFYEDEGTKQRLLKMIERETSGRTSRRHFEESHYDRDGSYQRSNARAPYTSTATPRREKKERRRNKIGHAGPSRYSNYYMESQTKLNACPSPVMSSNEPPLLQRHETHDSAKAPEETKSKPSMTFESRLRLQEGMEYIQSQLKALTLRLGGIMMTSANQEKGDLPTDSPHETSDPQISSVRDTLSKFSRIMASVNIFRSKDNLRSGTEDDTTSLSGKNRGFRGSFSAEKLAEMKSSIAGLIERVKGMKTGDPRVQNEIKRLQETMEAAYAKILKKYMLLLAKDVDTMNQQAAERNAHSASNLTQRAPGNERNGRNGGSARESASSLADSALQRVQILVKELDGVRKGLLNKGDLAVV